MGHFENHFSQFRWLQRITAYLGLRDVMIYTALVYVLGFQKVTYGKCRKEPSSDESQDIELGAFLSIFVTLKFLSTFVTLTATVGSASLYQLFIHLLLETSHSHQSLPVLIYSTHPSPHFHLLSPCRASTSLIRLVQKRSQWIFRSDR